MTPQRGIEPRPRRKSCVSRESNPGQLLGRQLFYRYTTNANDNCEIRTHASYETAT
ncbi:hypothetical protein BB561_006772 [Smittium simulii]|uniref:Uncharacterized protein n=1 Tax=Smittium simulii TaxID=133385 RepID=A0A2T9Y1R7_9FUNG|nr:hypothetical protein BB561_006772 [Smittium simulii]